MIIRLWFGSASGIALMVMVMLGIMHAAPYDDGGLSATLADPDCTAPCFIGIQPGATPFADAVALLEAHPWIDTVTVDGNTAEWTWSGAQPDFILIPPDDLAFTRMLSRNGVVSWIGFKTNAPTASFQVMFGVPNRTIATVWESYKPVGVKPYQTALRMINHQQRAQYDSSAIEIIAGIECSTVAHDLWDVPVAVSIPMQPIWNALDQLTVIEGSFARVPSECR